MKLRKGYLAIVAIITFVFSAQAFAEAPAKSKVTTQKTVKTKITKKVLTKPVASLPSMYTKSMLTDAITRIVSEGSGHARMAVYVRSMQNQDTLFSHNAYQWFTPASTLKMFTAESALLFLGPEYRFSTQLLTDAKNVQNGILQGNLYVILSGDPTLTFSDLLRLGLALRASHIQAIKGNVYIDNFDFDTVGYGPYWRKEDIGYCYAAPISASIVNRNCISLSVVPSKSAGKNAEILTYPDYFYPPIKNYVMTKSSGKGCGVSLSIDKSHALAIQGCLGKNQNAVGVSYVVTNIADYDVQMTKAMLNRLMINVFGTVMLGHAPMHLTMIGQHESKPLHVLITEMLKRSDNIIAGALFKKLGELFTHEQGSWKTGGIAVKAILAQYAGINLANARILDGSGLSPEDYILPSHMMDLLNFVYHHYPTNYEFISALPIAGVDGTLRYRMSNIAGRVRAKTGTIDGVVSLGGYVFTNDKEPLAFVIMINGFQKGMAWQYKGYEDQIVTILSKYKH